MSLLETVRKLKDKFKLANSKREVIFTLSKGDIDETRDDVIYVYMKIGD